MHGAAVTETVGDLEGDIISSVRNIVGPNTPIVVTLDLHAHITKEMVNQSSAILAWETYPHLDPYETGIRGAKILKSILAFFKLSTSQLFCLITEETYKNSSFIKISKILSSSKLL